VPPGVQVQFYVARIPVDSGMSAKKRGSKKL